MLRNCGYSMPLKTKGAGGGAMREIAKAELLLEKMRENERHMARLLLGGVVLSVTWLAGGLWLWKTGETGWALVYVLAAAAVDAYNLRQARENRRSRDLRRAHEVLLDFYAHELTEEDRDALG